MTNDFTSMCLATFASNYRVIAKSTNIEEEDFEEESNTDTGKKYNCFTTWVQLQEEQEMMQS